jgi:hypothetical protein
MKLELGKRYVRRDGEVTGTLERGGTQLYTFYDPAKCEDYLPDGRFWDRGEEPEDLIREYIENDALPPQSAPKASPEMRNADRPASEMTKREAIAAQAPPVPDWFKAREGYENVDRPHPTKVGCRTDTLQLVIESEMERLIRWQYTYADALLAELEKGGGE